MALNSRYTKGIEIEIGGNATKLKTALDGANRTIKTTQTELDTLKNNLKLEWNPDSFKRAQELAQRALAQTTGKADMLRKALAELDRQGAKKDGEQYQNLQRELSYVQVAAQKAEKQLKDLDSLRFDSLLKGLDETRDRLNTMGNKLTAGLTVPLVAAGVAGVKFASDTDESMNKVEVAFGAAADEVKAWSETTLNAIGLAQGTALDMAALFGDMGTSMGLPKEAAAEMSRTLVELAADLASFKNISISEANTALKSIFTGEVESLKNLGVVMTEANLKQYALAQGAKTAYEQMSQLEKVQLRYQYVLDMTKNAQGDFARTFDGAANQMRVCQESLKELAATAGDELLPVVTPMIARINELVQSFGDLDEGQRKLVVQTALFLAALGPALKLSGGLASAATTMIPLLSKMKNALTGVTAAQTALNAAQTATPWGAIAKVVGVLLAVLGSFAVTTALTQEKTDALTDSLQKSKEAYQELADTIAQKNTDIMSMVAALDELMHTPDRSPVQQDAMLSLIKQLNEAVPGLSLAYDQETDSINRTTEAIRQMAQAQADAAERQADGERLAQLDAEKIALADQLTSANERLTEAEAKVAEMQENGTYWMYEFEGAARTADKTLKDARKTVQDLSDAQADNAAEIEALEAKYPEAAEAAGELTDSLIHGAAAEEDAGAKAAKTAEELKDLTQKTVTQTGKTRALIDETDALSAAFREQGESGGISLDTALKLIDAGYAAAVAVDQETGAVRLNTAAYRELVLEKLNNQQTTLEDQRKRVQATLDLRAEAEAAVDAAIAYTTLAGSKEAVETAGDPAVSTEELQNQLKSLDAQIASLEALKNSLGSGSLGGTTSRRSGGGKTDSAYKAALEELDYLRSMDEINEAEYYARLEALRDKYLKENSEEWRSATVKLHDYRKKAQEDAYTEELADAKYFWDMDLISEAEYYRRMAELRDKYLEEDSDAWRRANTELYDYLKKCRDEQLAAAKAGYEAQLADLEAHLDREKTALKEKYERRKDEAKAAYEERKSEIQRELELEKERLNAVIDGIDREIQARRQLREDQDQDDAIAKAQKRLDAARAELAFARTDEDRAELAKEVQRMEEALAEAIQDKEDTLFYRQKEAEKEEVRGQIEAAEKAADEAQDAAERKYQEAVDQLERDYEFAVKRLERQYEAKAAQLEADYNRTLSGGSGGAGQAAKGGGAVAGGSLAAATAVLAGAMSAAAGAVTNSVVQHITRSNSASVTINEARSLTEGQVVNTVRKVLNSMDR